MIDEVTVTGFTEEFSRSPRRSNRKPMIGGYRPHEAMSRHNRRRSRLRARCRLSGAIRRADLGARVYRGGPQCPRELRGRPREAHACRGHRRRRSARPQAPRRLLDGVDSPDYGGAVGALLLIRSRRNVERWDPEPENRFRSRFMEWERG